jgi:hypothetical protein
VATRDLEIIDLARSPRYLNPFTEESLAYFLAFDELLGIFGDQMATPLEWRDDKREYRPCQAIAEAVRDAGYDGIRFSSERHRIVSRRSDFGHARSSSLHLLTAEIICGACCHAGTACFSQHRDWSGMYVMARHCASWAQMAAQAAAEATIASL